MRVLASQGDRVRGLFEIGSLPPKSPKAVRFLIRHSDVFQDHSYDFVLGLAKAVSQASQSQEGRAPGGPELQCKNTEESQCKTTEGDG